MEQNNSQSYVFTKNSTENFSNLRWVLDAMHTATKSWLQVLHVETSPIGAPFEGEKVMVSTDGMRVHIAKLKKLGLSDGDYKPIINKRSEIVLVLEHDVSFPRWNKAIPDTFWEYRLIDTISLSRNTYGQDIGTFYATLLSRSKQTMNADFLKPFADGTVWEMLCHSTNDTVRAVSFRANNRYAVIATMWTD